MILLGGTAIAAAVGIACAALLGPMPAQAQQPAKPQHPRHLRRRHRPDEYQRLYASALVGYKTPNIDRIAHEGMMFTDYYAENSCTAGRSSLHHRPDAQAHRPVQGRHPGRAGRSSGARHHHRPGAEAARLRHRPVRQEPSRRPRRVSADRSTASTSSSATSTT